MATIFDVAKYILAQSGPMTAMKLQKLAYYSQAWSLVWDEEALFEEGFQAWANGPVSPSLYNEHRGLFKVDERIIERGDVSNLTPNQQDSIDKVLQFYGPKTAQWLSDLTHREAPWLEARGELPLMAKCTAEITQSQMHEYYSAL